jgi:hypothetical protein
MKTTSYQIFSFLKQNRKIQKRTVKLLINSINKIGYVDAKPIIVNSNYEIIDGQHRFEACKQLNLPIVYEITDVNYNDLIVELNRNQKQWSLDEYINYYANLGVECYQMLYNFEKQHQGLHVSNAYLIFPNKKMRASNIRNGEIFGKNIHCDSIINFIYNAKQYVSYWNKKDFVIAVMHIHAKLGTEDINKILENIPSLPIQATREHYVNAFENILNRKKRTNFIKL